MWSLRIARPFEGYSMRKILTIVAALLVTCFLYIFASAPTTSAQAATTDTKAQWSGTGLTYEGQTYTILDKNDPAYNSSLPGTLQYLYVETPLSSQATGLYKAHIIYFSSSTPPQNAESKASYIVYDFVRPNKYTNATAVQQVTIAPEAPDAGEKTSSCKIEGGLGYVICPVATTMANAMDTLYDILTGFLVTTPVQTTQNNSIYRGWEIMRNFANVAFVIGFLVIIYSQVSSIGLSNYGIKKLLPRLIIAAILVNISYWICAIAVDLSNIAGYSLHDLFTGIANNLVGSEGNGGKIDMSHFWAELTAVSLTGTVAAGVGIASLIINPGSIFMLLPLLLGVLLAILVALLILAARQAIITIMIIVSPLAFVAYLLPNTEKYFEKWRELFTTMLVMFPIFSIIFGGAHLAGMIIINNATDLMGLMFGGAVLIAPAVITPLVVRFSGSLLGRIAGMVNNPNKGLIDRTRNFAKERGDQWTSAIQGNYKNRYGGALGAASRKANQKRQLREEQKKSNDEAAHNLLHENKGYKPIYEMNKANEDTKKLLEDHHQAEYNDKVRNTPAMLERKLQVNYTADSAKLSQDKLDTLYSEARSAQIDPKTNEIIVPVSFQSGGRNTESMVEVLRHSQNAALDLSLEAMRKQSAEHKQRSNLTGELLRNERAIDGQQLQQYAGGVRGKQGADSVLAGAVAAERKAYGEAMAEGAQLIKHFNLSVDQRQELVKGGHVYIDDGKGNTRTFDASDSVTREAAIEMQIKEGPVKHAIEIVSLSGSSLKNFKTTIASAAAEAKLGAKTSFVGGTTMDLIATGEIYSPERWTGVVQDNIAKGKISSEVLATIDVDAIQEYVRAATEGFHGNLSGMDPSIEPERFTKQYNAFRKHAAEVLDPDNKLYSGRIKENVRYELEEFLKLPDLP